MRDMNAFLTSYDSLSDVSFTDSNSDKMKGMNGELLGLRNSACYSVSIHSSLSSLSSLSSISSSSYQSPLRSLRVKDQKKFLEELPTQKEETNESDIDNILRLAEEMYEVNLATRSGSKQEMEGSKRRKFSGKTLLRSKSYSKEALQNSNSTTLKKKNSIHRLFKFSKSTPISTEDIYINDDFN